MNLHNIPDCFFRRFFFSFLDMTKQTVSTSQIDEQYPVKWQWLHRLIDRRSFQIFVLIVVCILNIVDLVVDWYFFISKATIQKVRTRKKKKNPHIDISPSFSGSCFRSTTTQYSHGHLLILYHRYLH